MNPSPMPPVTVPKWLQFLFRFVLAACLILSLTMPGFPPVIVVLGVACAVLFFGALFTGMWRSRRREP